MTTEIVNPPGTEQLSPAAFYGLWLAGLESDCTRKNYGGAVRDFADFLNAPSTEAAVEAMLRMDQGQANTTADAYRARLMSMKSAPSTINLRLSALRKLCRKAKAHGLIDWLLEVDAVKGETMRDTAGPGYGAIRKMMAAAKSREDAKGMRDHAIIRLFHDMGLRCMEVVGLDVADLELDRERLSVRGKGRAQSEFVTVPPPVAKAIAEWLELRGPNPGPLFVGMHTTAKGERIKERSVGRIVKAYGLEAEVDTHPHALRHSGITRAAMVTNGDMPAVCAFARHKNAATTLKYIDNMKDLAGQVARTVSEE